MNLFAKFLAGASGSSLSTTVFISTFLAASESILPS